MSEFKDPFHSLITDLLSELQNLHRYCKLFDEIRIMKEAAGRKKWRRTVAKVTGKDTQLEPLNVVIYQDNSYEIRRMIEKLDAYFIDMKTRYLWAQNRIAELSIFRIKNASLQRKMNSRRPTVIDEILDKQPRNKRNRTMRKFVMPSLEDTNLRPKEESALDEDQSRPGGSHLSTKICKIIHSLVCPASKLDDKGDSCKENLSVQEEAMDIDNRMHIIVLLEEIRERDEYIASLKEQMEVKDLEISRLMEVMQQEKLGM